MTASSPHPPSTLRPAHRPFRLSPTHRASRPPLHIRPAPCVPAPASAHRPFRLSPTHRASRPPLHIRPAPCVPRTGPFVSAPLTAHHGLLSTSAQHPASRAPALSAQPHSPRITASSPHPPSTLRPCTGIRAPALSAQPHSPRITASSPHPPSTLRPAHRPFRLSPTHRASRPPLHIRPAPCVPRTGPFGSAPLTAHHGLLSTSAQHPASLHRHPRTGPFVSAPLTAHHGLLSTSAQHHASLHRHPRTGPFVSAPLTAHHGLLSVFDSYLLS